jgi:hypothetical protein
VNPTPSSIEPQPSANRMRAFSHELLPDAIAEFDDMDAATARAIGEDVLHRAETFAALDRHTQETLTVPYAEDVVSYEPREAPIQLRPGSTGSDTP